MMNMNCLMCCRPGFAIGFVNRGPLSSKAWKQTAYRDITNKLVKYHRLVRLAYQPPISSTFLSEQISQQQPASSTFISEQTSTSHQPPAKRTD
jgi:hypothetical protein